MNQEKTKYFKNPFFEQQERVPGLPADKTENFWI